MLSRNQANSKMLASSYPSFGSKNRYEADGLTARGRWRSCLSQYFRRMDLSRGTQERAMDGRTCCEAGKGTAQQEHRKKGTAGMLLRSNRSRSSVVEQPNISCVRSGLSPLLVLRCFHEKTARSRLRTGKLSSQRYRSGR